MPNKQQPKGPLGLLLVISSYMTASVIGLAALGYFIDKQLGIEENYYTMALALLGVGVGLYFVYRSVKDAS
ncbi:MAG: AtpZ/AtpI family protein [Weeksellaceae bacterium]|nr:AtpZ/AtpI family protein [Weeksellaceae bacterium]